MLMLTRDTPSSTYLRSLIGRLGKAAEGAIADKDLSTELLKDLRSQGKYTTAVAAKDQLHLTRASVITQDDVVRLREAAEPKRWRKCEKLRGGKSRRPFRRLLLVRTSHKSRRTWARRFSECVSRLRANGPAVRKLRVFQWGS